MGGELEPLCGEDASLPSRDEKDGQAPRAGGMMGPLQGERGQWEGRVEEEGERPHPFKDLDPAEPTISKKGGWERELRKARKAQNICCSTVVPRKCVPSPLGLRRSWDPKTGDNLSWSSLGLFAKGVECLNPVSNALKIYPGSDQC